LISGTVKSIPSSVDILSSGTQNLNGFTLNLDYNNGSNTPSMSLRAFTGIKKTSENQTATVVKVGIPSSQLYEHLIVMSVLNRLVLYNNDLQHGYLRRTYPNYNWTAEKCLLLTRTGLSTSIFAQFTNPVPDTKIIFVQPSANRTSVYVVLSNGEMHNLRLSAAQFSFSLMTTLLPPGV
jgi:hypothetical protein